MANIEAGDIESSVQEEISWRKADLSHFDSFDVDGPISGCDVASCGLLSEKFSEAAEANVDAPERPALIFLSAATGMVLRPDEPNDPFGPVFMFEGRRSALPTDFVGRDELLAQIAARTQNLCLRARLADLSWLLNRRRANEASEAIVAYVDIVEAVEAGNLTFRFSDAGELGHEACNLLRRALYIGNVIGRDKDPVVRAKALVDRLRSRSLRGSALHPAVWFSTLALEFRIGDPEDVASSLEAFATAAEAISVHSRVDALKVVAGAYRRARRDLDEGRARHTIADLLEKEADAKSSSAMLSVDLLSKAIAELHGVRDGKQRRIQLRHKLVDRQGFVSEEMQEFSHEMDLTEAVRQVEEKFVGADLVTKLFIFADLLCPPDPEKMREVAKLQIAAHPLSSLFPTVHLDFDGKVIHRSTGGDLQSDAPLETQIAQLESMRRRITVGGYLEPARAAIMQDHFLSEEVFAAIVDASPFAPSRLKATFARGFLRYFQNDLSSSVYALVPLLEALLRAILQAHGHDVTVFDISSQTQQDRTLSSLLEQMRHELEAVFGVRIITEIERLFVKRPGPALRHEIAHGLLTDGQAFGSDAIYACALIFRLTVLPIRGSVDEVRARLGLI